MSLQQAVACLNDHTQKIKSENRALRHELLLLIRQTRALHEHKKQLEDQQRQLVIEQQYARDLKTLRSARQHKVCVCMCVCVEREREKHTQSGRDAHQDKGHADPHGQPVVPLLPHWSPK